MSAMAQPDEPAPSKPLRLWPGVVAVALMWAIRFGLPLVVPEALMVGAIGELVFAAAVIVWWLFFSRAPWLERIGGIVLIVAAMAVTPRILHPSIAGGMMGMMFFMYAIPVVCLALVVWAVATRHRSDRVRRATLVVAILFACSLFALVRTGGMTGDADSDIHWRWTKTPEERLLARGGEAPAPAAASGATAATPSAAAWPGFRGPDRDGVVHGVRIATDWLASPPTELWRRPVGPGWSSFAVAGGLFYTQEQRGEEEVVSCYNLSTGQLVWSHADAARFWESNGGAGPRATPTLGDGRVYTCGATGIVNALDAASGTLIWSRKAPSDTGRKIPGWGFASSPLVVGDLVVVATAGTLVAYARDTGELRWVAPKGGWGYSSPHLATIGGVQQILLLNGAGAISVAPADGKQLWVYPWRGDGIVQPALTADGDVLIGTGSGLGGDVGVGVRRVALAHHESGWTVEERWTSAGLKPYFNDFVVHEGHAYGFDGSILACIDLASGERTWKGGRYGHGQLILLADQGVLLVLSEQGAVALVAAAPDQFKELARFPAIEGKTWNHPVLAGDVLLVRNDQEMAAFRLALAGS